MKINIKSVVICLLALTLLSTSVYAQERDSARAKALDGEAADLAKRNDIDGAIVKANEAIQADPLYEFAHTRLGYLLLKKNELDKAMEAFEAALEIRALSHAAKTGKGIVFARKGDLRAAETVLKDALTLNPDPVRTHYELGLVYERLAQIQLEKAISHFKEGIKSFEEERK